MSSGAPLDYLLFLCQLFPLIFLFSTLKSNDFQFFIILTNAWLRFIDLMVHVEWQDLKEEGKKFMNKKGF